MNEINKLNLNEYQLKIIDKGLNEFGAQNGFPVIFVISTKKYDPPKHDVLNYRFITEESEIKCFKKDEMEKAADYAQSVNGEIGVFDPKQK